MRILLLAALLAVSSSALAQFSSVTLDGGGGGSFGSLNGTDFSTVSTQNLSSGSTYGLRMRSDYTFLADPGDGERNVQYAARMSLTTGDLPVLVSNLIVGFNAKLVNSGGGATTPDTLPFFRGNLYDNLGGSVLYAGTYLPSLTSNGYRVVNETLSDATPFVLRPRTDYTLYIDWYMTTTVTGSAGLPSAGFTLEGGSTLSPVYNGLSASFTAQTLPEPASMAALGIGAATLLRRRRR